MKSILFASILLLCISSSLSADCVAGQDGCNTCDVNAPVGTYKCATCAEGHFTSVSDEATICIACHDAKCATCTGSNIGLCTGCQLGYNLMSGTCQLPLTAQSASNNETESISATMRFDMTLAQFAAAGGEEFFETSTAEALKLLPSQVKVTDVQEGSVIILFKIYKLSGSTVTLTQLKTLLDQAVASGSMAVFPGVKILSYSSSVSGSCTLGQYVDSNDQCVDCPEGCPSCLSATECNHKKHVVGAVLGGVLGGLAVIMIAAIVFVKKDAILGLASSSPKSAQYGLAASSPTSPTVQTQAAHA